MEQPAVDAAASTGGLGVALLIAGMLLCFLGTRSLALAAACAGFGLGSGVAVALGSGAVVALLVGTAGLVGAVLLVRLVVGSASFLVGAIAAGVVASSVYRTLPPTVDRPATLVVVVMAAAAVLGGAAVYLLRAPLLAAITAVSGAGLVIRGAVEAGPVFLGFLRSPATWVESLVALAVLLALAWAGFTTQRQRAQPLPQ